MVIPPSFQLAWSFAQGRAAVKREDASRNGSGEWGFIDHAGYSIARGFGAGWLLMILWMLFGAALAVLSRGTALAIGLGILYGFVVEGLISGFGTSVPALHDVALAFLRTNGYSLVAPLRQAAPLVEGPGFFDGPFVHAWQALVVVVGYVAAFAGLSSVLLKRRDVT